MGNGSSSPQKHGDKQWPKGQCLFKFPFYAFCLRVANTPVIPKNINANTLGELTVNTLSFTLTSPSLTAQADILAKLFRSWTSPMVLLLVFRKANPQLALLMGLSSGSDQ